jgi:hypothetical protein
VLRAESLEKELDKAKKHSAVLRSKLDGAFALYHNEVQEMQAKSSDLVWKNKSLRQKNKGSWPPKVIKYLLTCVVVFCHHGELSAKLET